MAKIKKKIKESPYQQHLMLKCYECKRGYFGERSCSAGMFVKNKTSMLGCWLGERM